METPETPRDPHLWKQAKERVGFRMHLRSYLIVNTGLWLIYLVTNVNAIREGGFQYFFFPWPLFGMLGWGIGLVVHYFAVYHRPNERSLIEQEYENSEASNADQYTFSSLE